MLERTGASPSTKKSSPPRAQRTESRWGSQSPRLGQHVAHQEDGVGVDRLPLVLEMVGDEEEGLRQPATLLGVVAGPIGPGDLGGQGAHGPGVRHAGPVGAVLVRPVPHILAPELAHGGTVVGPAVNAGAAHAVLIAHDAQRLDLVAEVLHPCFRNARRASRRRAPPTCGCPPVRPRSRAAGLGNRRSSGTGRRHWASFSGRIAAE